MSDRVLVRRVAAASTSKGGIIIPDNAKEKPLEGIVLEVGPGRLHFDKHFKEVAVKKGDKVLIKKYSGAEVKLSGETLWLVREDDIDGVIEE